MCLAFQAALCYSSRKTLCVVEYMLCTAHLYMCVQRIYAFSHINTTRKANSYKKSFHLSKDWKAIRFELHFDGESSFSKFIVTFHVFTSWLIFRIVCIRLEEVFFYLESEYKHRWRNFSHNLKWNFLFTWSCECEAECLGMFFLGIDWTYLTLWLLSFLILILFLSTKSFFASTCKGGRGRVLSKNGRIATGENLNYSD